MKFFATISLCILLASCNNGGNEPASAQKTGSDSLMEEVMKGHNSGMAKMEKIDAAKSKIQHVIDSISGLTAGVQKNSSTYRMQLDSVFNRLSFASYAMEKWMNEFNMDTLKGNEDARMAYLKSEQSKIVKVNDLMIDGLKRADSLLKGK